MSPSGMIKFIILNATSYVQLKRWSSLATKWIQNWDKRSLHVMFYENLTRQTRRELESLTNFLGELFVDSINFDG